MGPLETAGAAAADSSVRGSILSIITDRAGLGRVAALRADNDPDNDDESARRMMHLPSPKVDADVLRGPDLLRSKVQAKVVRVRGCAFVRVHRCTRSQHVRECGIP